MDFSCNEALLGGNRDDTAQVAGLCYADQCNPKRWRSESMCRQKATIRQKVALSHAEQHRHKILAVKSNKLNAVSK